MSLVPECSGMAQYDVTAAKRASNALYFLFLWVAWIIAVWLTNPKAVSTEQAPVLSPSDTLRPP
jgi:hypothetical protein